MTISRHIPAYAAIAVVGFFWFKAHDAKVAAEALAEQRRVAWEAALDSTAKVTTRLAVADSALRLHEAQDRTHARADRYRLDSLDRRADSSLAVVDSLLASLPDTTPLVIAIRSEREAGAACRLAVLSCEALTLTLTQEIANRDSVVALLQPALERTRQLWAEAEKRSRPGLFGRIRIALPFMAGTALAVVLLR